MVGILISGDVRWCCHAVSIQRCDREVTSCSAPAGGTLTIVLFINAEIGFCPHCAGFNLSGRHCWQMAFFYRLTLQPADQPVVEAAGAFSVDDDWMDSNIGDRVFPSRIRRQQNSACTFYGSRWPTSVHSKLRRCCLTSTETKPELNTSIRENGQTGDFPALAWSSDDKLRWGLDLDRVV